MEGAGVPCGPVNSIDKVFDDPHVQSREMCIKMPHPLSGDVSLVANPIRFSESPVRYRRSPPTLGAHTEEVLTASLNMSGAELDALRCNGII
jgi:crotonobetainyl-CoA:carnitine CoA-transferase CaiB-like acyl-CoA transferase